jgi:hypothetical protein
MHNALKIQEKAEARHRRDHSQAVIRRRRGMFNGGSRRPTGTQA